MDLWNIKDLEPPPVNSCKVTTKEIDIRLLDIALRDGIKFFENQLHLHTEAAVISRVVYRSKMKFRNSKDFKSVEMLSRSLRNYQHLEIPRILKTLLDSIPAHYKVNSTYVLTKNMMDYVLVRLQGLGKTLCRMLEMCKIASTLMQQRIRLGHFWKVAILVLASTSRVFVITKNVLKYACELYANLLPFSSSLGNAGVRWLPEDYIFPNRLDEWLNINWLDLENNVIEIPDDEPSFTYLKLTDSDDDDDVEFCSEYILVKDESVLCEDTFLDQSLEIIEDLPEHDDSSTEVVEDLTRDIDVGEVIDLSDTESKKPKRKRKKKNTQVVENKRVDVSSNINMDVISLNSRDSSLANTPTRPKKRKNNRDRSVPSFNNSAISSVNTPSQSRKRKRDGNKSVMSLNNSVISSANIRSRPKKRKSSGHVASLNNSVVSLDNTPKRKRKQKIRQRVSSGNLSVTSSNSTNRRKKKRNVKNKKKLLL